MRIDLIEGLTQGIPFSAVVAEQIFGTEIPLCPSIERINSLKRIFVTEISIAVKKRIHPALECIVGIIPHQASDIAFEAFVPFIQEGQRLVFIGLVAGDGVKLAESADPFIGFITLELDRPAAEPFAGGILYTGIHPKFIEDVVIRDVKIKTSPIIDDFFV